VGVACSVIDAEASVGGGAFPTARIPSSAVAFDEDAVAMEARARSAATPVIGRITDRRFQLDMRTILPREEPALIAALRGALA
jgi:L-seryl-tRNA(Ser) seleniumtransferase